MEKIGEIIRKLRGNMTQEELSLRSGIDKAIISKIETGKMLGTVECHKKIAEVFGLKLSELYSYLEEAKDEPAQLHRGEIKTDTYKDFLEILTYIPLSKKMLPTFINLKPKQEVFLEETIKKVERFIIVLEGEVEIGIEGHIYILKKDKNNEKGDSLYSTSNKRHTIRNLRDSSTKILCVSSPPVL
ncbi:MAG: XRE family transcriptional regulator [Candidatus Omnitrophica bacterium]|nr:XRE family transcriptional regulator [Candidatus Omnitrophota bacterium]